MLMKTLSRRNYGVRNIPTLLVFKNGEVVDKLVGGCSEISNLREVRDLYVIFSFWDIENISSLETLEFFKKFVEGNLLQENIKVLIMVFLWNLHRLYNKGESTKYVDWKLFSRTDKLFVKNMRKTNLRCQIIIDTSSSMYYPQIKNPSLSNPNKILYSVYSCRTYEFI